MEQIFYLLLVIIILIFITFALGYTYYLRKNNGNKIVKIKKINAVKIAGIQLAGKLGFPTVNVKLSKKISCGFYMADSKYGKVTIIVGFNDLLRADCHFLNFIDEIDSVNNFEFKNLERIINDKSDIINTFNRGCCA
jgi:hypothetical protein